LPAIFKADKNVVITDSAIACMSDNTGGYQLINVFGKNFNKILSALISKKLIDKRITRVMNGHLLRSFYPMFIGKETAVSGARQRLKPWIMVYWSYPLFWKSIFPVLLKNRDK